MDTHEPMPDAGRMGDIFQETPEEAKARAQSRVYGQVSEGSSTDDPALHRRADLEGSYAEKQAIVESKYSAGLVRATLFTPEEKAVEEFRRIYQLAQADYSSRLSD